MRTILIIVMSLLCLGAHAGDNSKKKPSKNLTCCKVKKSLASFPYKNLKHSSDTPHHGQFFHEATVMPSRLQVIAGLHPHERFGIYVEGCLQ